MTICSGGMGEIFSGGTAVAATVNSGGNLFVSDGGAVISSIIGSGGDFYIESGGTAIATLLSSGGWLAVSSGCEVISTVAGLGGSLYIESGGTALQIVEEGGFVMFDEDGASVTFASHVFSNYVLDNVGATLHSGTTAVKPIIGSKGWFEVYSDGKIVSANVTSGGELIIRSGGTAVATIVSQEGILGVEGSGILENAIISSGGTLFADTDCVFQGLFVLGGTVSFIGCPIADANCANITFDISQRTTSDEVIIDDLTMLDGGTYSVSVVADQTNGQYKLAGNASTFNQNLMLTVKNTNLTATLTKGSKTTVGGKDYTLSVVSGNLCLTVAGDGLPAPLNLSGNGTKLSWSVVEGASGYVVEYSQDNFATVISVETETIGTEHYNVGSGTWQWRVRNANGMEWAVGNNIVVSSAGMTPTVVTAVEDDIKDMFFVRVQGTWDSAYRARHMGVHGGWAGTGEKVVFGGENRFGDIFQGCADENILLLTDDANGDALFIDDIYTESKNDLAKTQARLANIKEIRAGAGNDIVDLTSDKFDYTGSGLSIHGGLGDDTIWANNGDNTLFGDAGNDRLVGASGNDIIVGGSGDDSLHGGGGDDIFAFGGDWGHDSVEQLANGKVTLWFENGSLDKWNASTLTYTDGENRVKVSGVAATNVTLKFDDDGSEQYGKLLESGAFDEFGSEKIFENKNTRGMLA